MANAPFAVTTPMRPAQTNTQPAFELPAGSCDCHFHVFEPGYPPVADPQYTFPDATLRQYLRLTDVLGIDRMVLVQPTYYGEDNALTLDVLRELGPARCRGVIRLGEHHTDAELDDYHDLGVRAIRLDFFARATWPTADLIGYIERMAAVAKRRGWHLQFYTPGTVVATLLPFLADLETTFVIDHLGYGLTEPDLARLLDVLKHGSGWVKLSGPYRIAKAEPLGRALVAARPDRLIWGSDWPHLPNGQRDTGELLNLLPAWAPNESDRRQILVDGPTSLFFAD